MAPLTILVDMDNTIEGLLEAWVPWLNKKHGLCISVNDVKEWDMSKTYTSLDNSEIYAPLFCEDFWKTVKPYPDAVLYLEKLKNSGHKVRIVTSSSYKTTKMKFENVLFKHFPYITNDDIIITYEKQMVIGDVLIDDCPGNVYGGSYQGIILSQPYNISFDESKYGVHRCQNWVEIYEYILGMEDQKYDDYGWY